MTKKFRIWNKLAKIFVSNENAAENCNSIFSILPSGEIIENYCGSILKKDLSNFEIQQWTGLTDSQGVEIYEGDIIEYKISGYKYRDLVFYEGCSFKSGPLDKSSSSPLEGISEIGLIVGNVFESPIK